jgi:hypothetical protein
MFFPVEKHSSGNSPSFSGDYNVQVDAVANENFVPRGIILQ